MRPMFLLLSAAVLLGCSGILGDDTAETAAASETSAGVDQDPTCADYLACLSEVDAATFAAVQAAYGPEGSCWASAEAAGDCAEACATGLDQMHDAHPEEAACGDPPAPDAGILDGAWNVVATDADACASRASELKTMELQFDAVDTTHTVAEGWITFTVGSVTTSRELGLECTFEDDHLECPTAEGPESSHSLSADYSNAVITGEFLLTIQMYDEPLCDIVFPIRAER